LKTNDAGHGIYVYGPMGIGKTFTTIAFANELANRNNTVAFIFVPEIILKLKNGFDVNSDTDNFEFVNKLKKVDFLFLDDLGAEETNLWFYSEYLLIILNHRMQHHKPTFFNSNLNIDEFEKKLIILMHKSLSAKRLIERIRTLTKNESYEMKGVNKRY
jgi:primosomal protein DnaI